MPVRTSDLTRKIEEDIREKRVPAPLTSVDIRMRYDIKGGEATRQVARLRERGLLIPTGEKIQISESGPGGWADLYAYPEEGSAPEESPHTYTGMDIPPQRAQQPTLFDDDEIEFEDPNSISNIPNWIAKNEEPLGKRMGEYCKPRIFVDGDNWYSVIVKRIK